MVVHSPLVVLEKGCIHGFVSPEHLMIVQLFRLRKILKTVLHFRIMSHAALSIFFVSLFYCIRDFFLVGEIFLMKAMLNCCFFADLRVLNKYHSVESFSAFSNVYDSSGLFGIYLTTVS